MTFKIATYATGPDPDTWDTLESLGITDPDWTFQPYAEVVETHGGSDFGRGFASAGWHLNIARNEQRSQFRTYCPGASATVYISTPTNEDDVNGDPIFKNYLAEMHWMRGDEDKQIRHTLDVNVTFTHLVEVD